MKKRIFAVLLCIVFSSLLCVSVFATDDIAIIGGADGPTQIVVDDESIYDVYDDVYDYDDYYTDGALEGYGYYDEEFLAEIESNPVLSLLAADEEMLYMINYIGIDNFEKIIVASVIIVICCLLFTPALVLLIVFAVLNSKTKKKIREYEIKKSVINTYVPASPVFQPQPVTAQPQQEPAAVVTEEAQAIENTQEDK